MKDLIINLIFGMVIYISYMVAVFVPKKGLNRFLKNSESSFILSKYNIELEYLDKKRYAHSIIITNTLILFIVLTIVGYVENLYMQLLVGFAIALPLIYLAYSMLGSVYKEQADEKRLLEEEKEKILASKKSTKKEKVVEEKPVAKKTTKKVAEKETKPATKKTTKKVEKTEEKPVKKATKKTTTKKTSK